MFKKFKKKIKKKFSNSGGQLKPDPDNVITQLPTHEPEECFYIWMATFRPCQKQTVDNINVMIIIVYFKLVKNTYKICSID